MKSMRRTTKKEKKDEVSPDMILETRSEIRELLTFAIDYLAIPITVDEILQQIFEEEKGEADRQYLLNSVIRHIQEPELISSVYRLLNHAWLFFPHHFLNGMSPIEVAGKTPDMH